MAESYSHGISRSSEHRLAIGPKSPSLRRYKLHWLFLITLIPGTIAVLGLAALAYLHERTAIERDLQVSARAMSQAMEREMLGVERFLLAMASASHELQSGNFAIVHREAVQALAASKLADAIVITDATGQQLVNTFVPFGQPLPVTRNMERVRGVFASQRPYYADVHTGTVSRKPLITIDVPVFRNGQMKFSLTAVLLAERLSRILEAQALPEDWRAVVVDRNGNIAGRSHGAEKYIGQKAAAAFVDRLSGPDEGVLEATTLDGIQSTVAYSRSQSTGFTVALSVPRKAMVERMYRDIGLAEAAVVLVTLLTMLSAWRFGGLLKAHQEAEAAAQRERQRFYDVLESLPAYVALVDSNRQIVFGNKVFRERFGDTSGVPCHGAIFGRDLPCPDCGAEEGPTGGADGRMEHVTADGTTYAVFRRRLLLGAEEPLILHLGMDITEQKKAKEALRQRMEELHRLMEAVPAGVFVAEDPACDRIVANRQGKAFYEAGERENISQNKVPRTRHYYTPGGRELTPAELPMQVAARTNRRVSDVEIHVETPSGRMLALLGSAVPLRDDKGGVRGALAAFVDITELRRAYDQVLHLNAELERRVDERTVQLNEANASLKTLNADLEQRLCEISAAKAAADQANNAKSRFLAAVSHDLRQPLSTLSLYVGTLADKLAPEDAQLAANMKNCVVGLSEMLSNLLDLSRLDAGTVSARVSDFSLDVIVGRVVSSLRPEAQAKHLSLRYASFGVIGRTDPTLFQSIVGNLVSNAIRYTERGGVLIGTRRREGRTWVEVWDTGIGIPEERTAEIFEEFRQLGNHERNRAKGTGLGLAIVAKSASLLGLQVRMRSRPGKGSLFAVELPRGQRIAAPVVLAPPPRALKIALVEDNEEVAVALTYALRNLGHEVRSAASLSALLVQIDGLVPDAVISDYRLAAGEDGIQVIESLKARFGHGLAAIIITGDTDPATLRRIAEKGIALEAKPLNLEALNARLAQLTRRSATA